MLAVNHLIKTALSCDKPSPRCAYLAPLRNQAKQIAWDYVKQYARPIPGTVFNESELRADFPNGARLTLYGCDNPDTLRGIYLDAVVLDEYAQMPPRVWGEVVRPCLSDREGSALFIGTPFGKNEFWKLWTQAPAGSTAPLAGAPRREGPGGGGVNPRGAATARHPLFGQVVLRQDGPHPRADQPGLAEQGAQLVAARGVAPVHRGQCGEGGEAHA